MKPDDLCIVDMDGKQVSGKRKRSSEILLHLSIMKARPDVKSCVHCHPPHATAFAVAHEPIPKCTMPEFEVFLGEVAITPYETPGTQAFADTVIPYVKDTDTILLANHGTITCGARPDGRLLQDRDHRRLLPDPDPGQAARHGQLLLRRQGRRADQDQAEPRASATSGSRRASRTATSAATASSARGTPTSSPSPRRSSPPKLQQPGRSRRRSPSARAARPPLGGRPATWSRSSRRSPTRSCRR